MQIVTGRGHQGELADDQGLSPDVHDAQVHDAGRVVEDPQPVSSVAWFFDDEPVSGSSVRLTAGTHVVEAHLTLASGESKIVELTIRAQ